MVVWTILVQYSFRQYRGHSLQIASDLEANRERFKTYLKVQGPLNGGVSNGGVSRSRLVLPSSSFLSLFWTFPIFFRDFPDVLGDGPGIFPIRLFSLSQPTKSTYEETVPKGSATQSGPSPKKVGNPPVWKPPGLASLKK